MMNKFIISILHEEKLSEESLLSVTGGASEEKKSEESSNSGCGDTAVCKVAVIVCPELECFRNL